MAPRRWKGRCGTWWCEESGDPDAVLIVDDTRCALSVDRNGHVGVGIALACFVAVAIMWIVPDRRIDRAVRRDDSPD
jgi:hypothetical protein